MINYETSILQSQITSLKIWIGILLFLICVMFILIKVLWKSHEDTLIIVERINRDNELRYEDIKKFICPNDLNLYECEKCNKCISKQYKDECWVQHFINKIKNKDKI